MSTGTVKFFNGGKGFGFIKGDDGREIFVHATQIVGEAIAEGDKVQYTEGQGQKGPQAENVQKI